MEASEKNYENILKKKQRKAEFCNITQEE